MKDTAPKELGIIAVAALFGLVALVVALAVLKFSGFASVLIGAIVAIITAIVLWFGWRDAAPGPTGPRDLSPTSADTNASGVMSPTTGAPSTAGLNAPAAAMTSADPASADAGLSAEEKKAANQAIKAEKAARKAAKEAKIAKGEAKPAAAKSAKPAAAKAPPVAADGKPETLTAPRAGSAADDLKQIKGVGPQLEKALNEMGFWHFDQVAAWRKKEVEWVDSRLKFKGRIERDEWIKQAKTLAKGGTTEFSSKVKKGGVY